MFWSVGYGVAFGIDQSRFIGVDGFFLYNVNNDQFATWFFQFAFAVTASTIVSGALAERCRFEAYFIYSALITGLIYPVVAHWTWSERGWLRSAAPWSSVNFIDYAGSGTVHLTGGTAAFMGAWCIGPRSGRFVNARRAIHKRGYSMPGHSVPLVALGGFILLLGFLAFNGGSAEHMVNDAPMVASIFMNTLLSSSGGAIVSVLCDRLHAKVTGS